MGVCATTVYQYAPYPTISVFPTTPVNELSRLYPETFIANLPELLPGDYSKAETFAENAAIATSNPTYWEFWKNRGILSTLLLSIKRKKRFTDRTGKIDFEKAAEIKRTVDLVEAGKRAHDAYAKRVVEEKLNRIAELEREVSLLKELKRIDEQAAVELPDNIPPAAE